MVMIAIVVRVMMFMVMWAIMTVLAAILALAQAHHMGWFSRLADQDLGLAFQRQAEHLDPEQGQPDALAVRQADARRGQGAQRKAQALI